MRKFRASLEPFWDLKIGRYVEYLIPVSSEYLKLRAASSDKYHWPNFTAYVIPWRPCAIYSTHSSVPWSTDLKFGRCRVCSYIETFYCRGRVGLRFHFCDWGAGMWHRVRIILTTFYHMHHYHYAATGDVVQVSYIHINMYIACLCTWLFDDVWWRVQPPLTTDVSMYGTSGYLVAYA